MSRNNPIKLVPPTKGRLPMVLVTWTETVPGRGVRQDGISVHLTNADLMDFVRTDRSSNKASKCDGVPYPLDASASLHEHLTQLRAAGSFGVRTTNREEERLLREGENPYSTDPHSVEIIGNKGDRVFDPKAMDVSLLEARKRVDLLDTVGIDAIVVDDDGEVVYGVNKEQEADDVEDEDQPRRRARR